MTQAIIIIIKLTCKQYESFLLVFDQLVNRRKNIAATVKGAAAEFINL